MHYHGLYGSTR